MTFPFRPAALAGLVALWAFSAHAHDADHGATDTDGAPGNAADVTRAIRIEARDIGFDVNRIQVRAHETIRFVITNAGALRHEFVIASAREHEEHRAMMRQMPDMVHTDANMVSLDPGQAKDLIWRFGTDADIQFACDIPGHAEAGMAGIFRVMK